MSGLCNKASTATLSPCTTLKTPSGRPASVSHFAIIREGDGSLSEGFKIKQFPQTRATGNIHIGTIPGKLKGVIPATTPNDCLTLKLSTSVPTFSV